MNYIRIKKILNKVLPKFIFNFIIKFWRNTYVKLIYKIRKNSYKKLDTKNIFTKIYNKNIWGSNESISGPGSEYKSTKEIRGGISKIIKDYNIKKIIDAPCGDVNWIEPEKMGIDYIGCDIVEELIIANKNKFKSKNINFQQLDITKDKLPNGDLFHCRECLQHLSQKNINSFIKNIKKSNVKYLLTTTHDSLSNVDIIDGEYFQINLEIEPYNFPNPILKIEEIERNNITGEKKYLALWEVNKINN